MLHYKNYLAVVAFLLAPACDNALPKNADRALELAAKPQVIAQSVMRPVQPGPAIGSCLVGRSVTMESAGGALRLKTYKLPLVGCEGVRLAPDHRTYEVASVTLRGRNKIYEAEGPHQNVTLIDRRANDDAGWQFVIEDYAGRDFDPRTIVFESRHVDDRNTTPKPWRAQDYVVVFDHARTYEEVHMETQSLVLDPAFTAELGDAKTWQLRVLTNFTPLHVWTQLLVLDSVDEVTEITIHQDPRWPRQ